MTSKFDIMKKTIILAALAVICACEHDIVRETDFNVTLDSDNTFFAGEPVRFNFEGEVDNVIFYSGEVGSQYIFKDRYSVSAEQVKKVTLDMDFQARYGTAGALEVWVSDSFEGLTGTDAAADSAIVKAMVDGGMKGWKKLDYQEGSSETWTEQQFDLTDYVENFSIAFHWCPSRYDQTQRTYWINGQMDLTIENAVPVVVDISELGFITVMMNEQIEDPYHKNAGDGSIILNKPDTGDLVFQGIGGGKLDYALDGWAVSTPRRLNTIPNDKANVIKNIQNYMPVYEYTWNTPGTYRVTFIGTNETYSHATSQMHEMNITILENLN